MLDFTLIRGLEPISDRRVGALLNREKAKSKEREEAWLKIENLAKSNPQVSSMRSYLSTIPS